jgi:hypothetical protein
MARFGDKPQLIAIGIAPLGIICIAMVPMAAVRLTTVEADSNEI